MAYDALARGMLTGKYVSLPAALDIPTNTNNHEENASWSWNCSNHLEIVWIPGDGVDRCIGTDPLQLKLPFEIMRKLQTNTITCHLALLQKLGLLYHRMAIYRRLCMMSPLVTNGRVYLQEQRETSRRY